MLQSNADEFGYILLLQYIQYVDTVKLPAGRIPRVENCLRFPTKQNTNNTNRY